MGLMRCLLKKAVGRMKLGRLFGGEAGEDLYKALEVSREASEKEIKAAFHRLTKLYHPDINPEYEDKYKQIVRAYHTLNNESRRRSFDAGRKDGAAGGGHEEEDPMIKWAREKYKQESQRDAPPHVAYFDDRCKGRTPRSKRPGGRSGSRKKTRRRGCLGTSRRA